MGDDNEVVAGNRCSREVEKMADVDIIEVTPREKSGRAASRALRAAGLVPAIVYGEDRDPAQVTVDRRIIIKELNRGSFLGRVYQLQMDGKSQSVLPRDIQFHPVSDEPIHVDFLRLADNARIAVDVPVVFINEEESAGLKRGGILNVVRHEVELECPSTAIPEQITVDLAGLDIGATVHISAIDLPEGVTPTITDRDFTIATIATPSGGVSDDDDAGEEEGEEEGGEE